MNELIKTFQNDDGITLVNGRSLHEFLEVNEKYTQWFERMVEYGFTENVDFVGLSEKSEKPSGGRPKVNHALTMDMAKELSMIQRTEKGKAARQYFISMEKRAQMLPVTPEEKIKLLLENSQSANGKIKAVTERVEHLEEDQMLAPGEYSYIGRQCNKAVKEYVDVHQMKLTTKQRALLHKDISNGLNTVTGVRTRTQLREKHFELACKYIEDWVPSTATLQLIKAETLTQQ